MKAETLRDLISRKHPPTIRWLSNPGLLKHSTQSIEKCVPCTQRGAPRTGWAGEMQPPLTREVRAAVFTQAYAELCRQPAACLLAAEMENYLSVPTTEQGWESSCLSSQEHFHLLPAAPPPTAPKGNRNSGTAVLAHASQTHMHTGYLCSLGQKIALPAPRASLPHSAGGAGGSSGPDLATLQLQQLLGRGMRSPRQRLNGDPRLPGKGLSPKTEAGRVLFCHAHLLPKHSEAESRSPWSAASLHRAEACSAGG